MGSGISDIAGDVSSLKNIFNPQLDPNQTVQGTGSTVGDLKKDYPNLTDDDLKQMGAKSSPSAFQQGLGAGLQQGLNSYGQAQQNINRSAKPVNITTPAPPSVNGFGTPQPLQVPTLFTTGNVPRTAFFGG